MGLPGLVQRLSHWCWLIRDAVHRGRRLWPQMMSCRRVTARARRNVLQPSKGGLPIVQRLRLVHWRAIRSLCESWRLRSLSSMRPWVAKQPDHVPHLAQRDRHRDGNRVPLCGVYTAVLIPAPSCPSLTCLCICLARFRFAHETGPSRPWRATLRN